jgi:hypothetical protein
VKAQGSDLVVEDTFIHDVASIGGIHGSGIHSVADDASGEPGQIVVRRSVVERVHQCGVCLFDADGTVERVTVRDVAAPTGNYGGSGMQVIGEGFIGRPPQAVFRESMLDGSEAFGLGAAASDLLVEGLVVRGVAPRPELPMAGVGITIEPLPATRQRSVVTVRGVVVHDTPGYGIAVFGSDATIEGAWIHDVTSNPMGGLFGRGMASEVEVMTGLAGDLTATNCLVEDVHEVGIAVLGSSASLRSVTVRRVEPSGASQFGVGILFQLAAETGDRSSGEVRTSVIEDVQVGALMAAGSDIDVARTVVRRPAANPFHGEIADGIVANIMLSSAGDREPSHITIDESIVTDAPRAGVATFGSEITIGGSWLECNTIQLNGETVAGNEYAFVDLGSNVCGCGGTTPCKMLSSSLAAPPTL